jgi:hypothetical protein
MAEAADLGAALARRYAGSVWRVFLPVHVAVMALALSTAEFATWLPALLIFWLKPWLDRSLLFVFARAAFGEPTRWADLWSARRQVWGGNLVRTLLWRRFSPWRSFTQPIEQLEGQRGGARRDRRKQLLYGRGGAGIGLQFAFGNVEVVLYFGLIAILFWFAPEGNRLHLFEWLTGRGDISIGASLVGALIYAVVVAALEPFYVAAGFGMYLNRRVELEAWDIEQAFRAVFAPKAAEAEA